MSKNEEGLNEEQLMLVQKHQIDQAQMKMSELGSRLNEMDQTADETDAMLDEILGILGDSDISVAEKDINYEELLAETEKILTSDIEIDHESLDTLDLINSEDINDWNKYQKAALEYVNRNNIDITSDPFERLLTDSQRIEIEKKIQEDFTHKSAACDKYDYMLAATCGLIGGLIDVVFVGTPDGALTKVADNFVDSSVEKFAGLFGWEGASQGKDSTKSAIGFLERQFEINYDQATTNGEYGTGGAVKNLSTKNHHVKSLGHSPDLIGLFFSILNQFTNTSSFVSDGKIITIDTKTHELQGGNVIAKIFSGFVNWLGHLFSDMAGSSGATGRGSGIPIPFYNLLLLLDVGEFGKNRQNFAKVATQVFEKGYDFRHGLAMAVPVIITELLTRIMWVIKQRFYHNKSWSDCLPNSSNPELRRMLLIAHGSLCLVDGVDAGLRSGGNVVSFMLRANIVGWARFGTLALKEIEIMIRSGSLDHEAIDAYIDDELERLLQST